MSICSDALQTATSNVFMNTVIAGETVTFRSASVAAHIDRLGGDGTEPPGAINTSTNEEVRVLFPPSTSEPRPGEIITTGASHKLRIEHVRWLVYGWQCRCAIKR
jgi:hypothetical protein